MLLRDGQYVPLTPKAIDTLCVLVRHHGRIVEKEDLLKEVWPATFVEDVTLAKNISLLRKILADANAPDLRYIETVPRRGYRFSADVRILQEASPPSSSPQPPAIAEPPIQVESQPSRRKPSLRILMAGAALVLAAGVALALYRRPSSASASAPLPSWKIVPVTSLPGSEDEPALSPDGQQIAFVRTAPADNTPHIYVKAVRAEDLRQLTAGPGVDSKPAWSPDGRFIAFERATGSARAWDIISSSGGEERKIADGFPYIEPGPGNSPWFSPDGKYLAVCDRASAAEPSSIYFISVAGSTRRKITSPPAATSGDRYPAFSPDGTKLAFARAGSFSSTDLFVLSLDEPDSSPRRITFDAITIQGLTWTNDGRDIVFSSRRGGSINNLWRIHAEGGTPRLIGTIGKDVTSPTISRGANRLCYAQTLDDMNIWTFALARTGRARSSSRLIASTFKDSDPDFSPDARHIAFASGRSGGFGIWISDSDGSNARQLFEAGPYVTGSPRWSPDGRSIAFDSRAGAGGAPGDPHIYIADLSGPAPRRLSEEPGVAPSWSCDGRWIYFSSTRNGSRQIWKMQVTGGVPVQVTRHGGFEGYESSDGRYLYFLKDRATPGIWRVPVNGGDETLVTNRYDAGLWRSWRLSGDRIYFATSRAPAGSAIELLNLATREVHEVARLTAKPDIATPGLAVSADGQRLLESQYDETGSDVLMLDGFR
jgi:Tol biopolymer transport system component/DNA-binding winged helix-turn-helix (wHTH) protein